MDSLVRFAATGTAGETESRILSALDAGEIDIAMLLGADAMPLDGETRDARALTH